MPTLFQLRSFLTYWLDAVDEHSLHSPFYYDFCTKVVKVPAATDSFGKLENARAKYLTDQRILTIEDHGKGSRHFASSDRTIADIARTSLSQSRFSELYVRIIRHFAGKNILELGTSLGINTLYLASVPGTRVTTFEGSAVLANEARNLFKSFDTPIELVEGNLDHTLSPYLVKAPKIDFAFVDANHQLEPTTRYVKQLIQKCHPKTVIVVDDIHLSEEMEQAWNTLRQNPLVYGSLDLYRCGILFFDPSLNKQHVVLQF